MFQVCRCCGEWKTYNFLCDYLENDDGSVHLTREDWNLKLIRRAFAEAVQKVYEEVCLDPT